MKGIKFKESNAHAGEVIFSGNGLDPLPIYTDGKTSVSVWELTNEEIAQVIKTRKVYMMVRSGAKEHPAVYLGTERLLPDSPIITL